MKVIKKLFHWFAHKFGFNQGSVVSWEEDSYIYVGFECSGCKVIDPETINKIESEFVYGK